MYLNNYDGFYEIFRQAQPITLNSWIQWERSFGFRRSSRSGNDNIAVRDLQPAQDGGYFLAGYVWSDPYWKEGMNQAPWVVKLNEHGKMVWQHVFEWSYSNGVSSAAHAVQAIPEGGIMILRKTRETAWLRKLDNHGQQLWEHSYVGSYLSTIQLISDNNYIIAGRTTAMNAEEYDAWIFKIDALGQHIWECTFDSGERDVATAIQQTQDGGFIVGGFSIKGTEEYHAWVIKLDAQGQHVWERIFDNGGHNWTTAIQQTQDGDFIVIGVIKTKGAEEYHAWVVKLDAQGQHVWERILDSSSGANAIQQTLNGDYIVIGNTALKKTILVIKFNAQGQVMWEQIFHSNNLNTVWGTQRNEAIEIQPTADGGSLIAGYTGGGYSRDDNSMWVIKLKPEVILR